MGISTEHWRISVGSFTQSFHRSKPKRLQQNPSTRDYDHIMKPVAHTLLALLIVLSLMSAFTGIISYLKDIILPYQFHLNPRKLYINHKF